MSKNDTNAQINTQADSHNKNKHSFLPIIIIIAMIVICILIGVIVYLLSLEKEKPKVNNIVTPDNVEEIISQMKEDERTPVGSYEVSMNTEWIFPDGNSPSTNAYVENSVTNQNTVYFTINLSNETEEKIYHSPYLTLGSSLTDIKLDSNLSKGNYDAIITYYLVDEDFKELSSVSMYMKLSIEN